MKKAIGIVCAVVGVLTVVSAVISYLAIKRKSVTYIVTQDLSDGFKDWA